MKARVSLLFVPVCLFAVGVCFAQDPVKVDPKHYKVESENAKVRILSIHYGPHEKSVMHSHPDSVVIYLTDGATAKTEKKSARRVFASIARSIEFGDLPRKSGLVFSDLLLATGCLCSNHAKLLPDLARFSFLLLTKSVVLVVGLYATRETGADRLSAAIAARI